MTMSYASSTAPPAIRLGLRARVRAVLEARMVSERSRRRLALAFERSVVRAEQPRGGLSAAVPVARDAMGDAREALLDLAERLRAPRPVDADGMRLARSLLIDGASPLYVSATRGELRDAAIRALEALDGHGPRH
jgi:hypothetical protein